jgi:FkbM family methyltransferase
MFVNLHESPMMLARALSCYETDKHQVLRRVLQPGMTFIDIGSNKGDFALLAAKVMGDRGRVLAFEPAPANIEWLRRSVERNSYRCVEVVPCALGDSHGDAVLHLSAQSGLHTLHDPHAGHQTVGSVSVPVRRLDDVLRERGIDRVDVGKIDVEGAELEVLQGASETLDASYPCTLLIDLHPPIASPPDVCDLLRSFGFTIRSPRPPYGEIGEVDQRVREIIAERGR